MSAQHTPGPWAVDKDCDLIIVDHEGGSLGEMTPGNPAVSDEQAVANARLVAAAPELLKALKEALGVIRMSSAEDDTEIEAAIRRVEKQCKVVIAKAEGR